MRNVVNLNLGTEWATYPHHLRSRSPPLGNLGTTDHTIVLSLLGTLLCPRHSRVDKDIVNNTIGILDFLATHLVCPL